MTLVYYINPYIYTYTYAHKHIHIHRHTYMHARQTRPNSGGVAEDHPRFNKGGVAIIFHFLRVKNRTFRSFYAKRLKKAYF